MPKTAGNEEFMELVRAIVAGESERAARLVEASPGLVQARAARGASRGDHNEFFFEPIRHYLYAGDTALHIAAAGFRWKIIRELLARGADYSAENRRGAQPLHYASDANTWNPASQVASIESLIRAGANPNALDKNGVAPLHRAVRTRSAAAVAALLIGGADPRLKNKSGSTPLHLAVQNTGRGGTGEPHSIEQQRQIILILLQNSARPGDRDGQGRTVEQATRATWIRELLEQH